MALYRALHGAGSPRQILNNDSQNVCRNPPTQPARFAEKRTIAPKIYDAGYGRAKPARQRAVSAVVTPPTATPLPQSIGATYSDDSLDTARGIVYGVLICVACVWAPLIYWWLA